MLGVPGFPTYKDRLADWLEINVLFSDRGRYAMSTFLDELDEDGAEADLMVYDELVDPALGEDRSAEVYSDVRERQAEGTSEFNLLATDAFLELEYRAGLVGDSYPIGVRGDVLERSV